jgi:glycosyltransferase involved in cell wall biosynthesis
VDDDSTDGTPTVAHEHFPFAFVYARQKHKGATAARNLGAAISQAEVLIFLDDDVTVSPQTLEAFAEACYHRTKVLVMGTLYRRSSVAGSVYSAIMLAPPHHAQAGPDEVDLPFVECNTELLACRRTDFLDLDMLHDPTEGAGWPNWDDVDFGYRAHLSGFRLLQSGKAIGEHWDYSASNWIVACQRWHRASRSAVWLFHRHPELKGRIPMLHDKTPIVWGQDSALLVARKLARLLGSSPLIREGMRRLISFLERQYPSPALLSRLYYWLEGAYMLQGYRQGLREFEREGTQ